MGPDHNEVRVHLRRELDDLADGLARAEVDSDREPLQPFRRRGPLVDVEPQVIDEIPRALRRRFVPEHVDQMQLAAPDAHGDACGLIERGAVRVGEAKAYDKRERPCCGLQIA